MAFTTKQWWAAYFSFTKKERLAVLVLLPLVVAVFMLPAFFSTPEPPPDKLSQETFRQQAAQLKAITTADALPQRRTSEAKPTVSFQPLPPTDEIIATSTLFHFDPNTLSAEGWQRLGIRDRTITTIRRYLAKGGQFKHPEDIRKIYGISAADATRLLPYVKIAVTGKQLANKQPTNAASVTGATVGYHRTAIKPIDINTADTNQLIALPGIGSRLARRLIDFRNKLGGFYRIEQVAETYALPDSTFQKISPWLVIDRNVIRRLNINSASIDELKLHPYIKWSLGNAIVQYRQQHGPFNSVDELKQIALMTAEMFEKIAPYCIIN